MLLIYAMEWSPRPPLTLHAVYLRPEMQEYSHTATKARSRQESKVTQLNGVSQNHPYALAGRTAGKSGRRRVGPLHQARPSARPSPTRPRRRENQAPCDTATTHHHFLLHGRLPSIPFVAGRVRGQSLAVAGFGTASCPGPIRARVFRCAGGNDSGARWPLPHAGWRCLGDPRILAPRGSSWRSWPNACSRALRTLAPHFTFVLVP